jgi:hypothetical protein
MANLQHEEQLFKKLQIKLAINRYLRKWNKQFAQQLFHIVRCDDPALYGLVLDEMASEGLIVKEIGPRGALTVVYQQATEADQCPKS